MKTIYESSNATENYHISLIKYRNLNNISHYHSDYELIYINCGNATVAVNENIFNLEAGNSIFINSDDIHFIESNESSDITVMKVKKEFLDRIFDSKSFPPLLCEREKTQVLMEEIENELYASREHGSLMIDCAVTRFCVYVFRSIKAFDNTSVNKKCNSTEFYSKITTKIFKEYSTVTFLEAANHMHFSGPYFSKVFNSIFGMNFTRYLNNVKIAAAIDMIKNSTLSMTEIAEKCGFKTIRSYNRVFKELTGYAPSNLPSNFVFMYSFQKKGGLDPTLNCTIILTNYC